MEIQKIKISKIVHNTGQIDGLPANPRKKNDVLFDKLVKSIEEDPEMLELRELLVYPHGDKYVVIAGNMRLDAMKQLGFKDAPCKVISSETPVEKLKAYTIKDNASFGEWDVDLLVADWDVEQLEDWGVELPEDDIEVLEEQEVEEDNFDESEVTENIVQPLDVWKLGEHRLMCGDSTSANDVAVLMGGVKADLVFTDPPYGMKKESEGVKNDNLNYDDLLEFNKQWIPNTFANLKDNGSWYCWGIDEPLMDIYVHILKPMIKANKATFRNLITWNKGSGQGQMSEERRCYARADEKCLFVMCGVQGFNTNADNYYEGWESIRKYLDEEMKKCGGSKNWSKALGNQMGKHFFTKSQWQLPTRENYERLQAFGAEYGAFKREYDEIKREYDEIKREYYSTRAYFDNTHDNMNDVWNINTTTPTERADCGGHATPKPLELCQRAIKSSSRDGESVMDLFGGSGSTLIACEQLHRKCYMMELDPHYCDVIIARWEKLTGKKAEKIV